MLILPAILSDPEPGMLRDGWRGIVDALNTGRVFGGSILIGTDTGRVSVIGINVLSNSIMARAVGGTKESKAAPLLQPDPKDANQVRLKWPPLNSSTLVCGMNLNRNSSTLVCGMSLNRNSSISRCSDRNNSTGSNNRDSKVTIKRNKSRKGTNNNSKGWNPVDLIPVRTCRSQEGSVFLGSQFTVTISRQTL